MNEPKQKRGFAAMDPEKQREIARRGGLRAQELGVAHKFDEEEARQAGRKGGQKTAQNREHMARIGRIGGSAARSDNDPR